MDLRDALSQITDIRTQLAAAQTFRGYRSLTTAISGLVAVLAACAQAMLIDQPRRHLDQYLLIWFIAALISMAVIGAELVFRAIRSTPSQRQMSWFAIEQFMPSLVAGLLITYVITLKDWSFVPLLPGLWAILFGMGVFASRRLLPRPTFLIGGFYMIAGLLIMTLKPSQALSPWTMGLTFGIGQFAAALMLYWTLERNFGEQNDGDA